MEYKVVPIVPVQKEKEGIKQVAQDLEDILRKYQGDGWDYVRVEILKTWVNPVGGCFGLGQTPGYYLEIQMVVFKR